MLTLTNAQTRPPNPDASSTGRMIDGFVRSGSIEHAYRVFIEAHFPPALLPESAGRLLDKVHESLGGTCACEVVRRALREGPGVSEEALVTLMRGLIPDVEVAQDVLKIVEECDVPLPATVVRAIADFFGDVGGEFERGASDLRAAVDRGHPFPLNVPRTSRLAGFLDAQAAFTGTVDEPQRTPLFCRLAGAFHPHAALQLAEADPQLMHLPEAQALLAGMVLSNDGTLVVRGFDLARRAGLDLPGAINEHGRRLAVANGVRNPFSGPASEALQESSFQAGRDFRR